MLSGSPASDEKGSYDLHAEYGQLKGEETAKGGVDPWLPIDVNLVTPNHIKNKYVLSLSFVRF